jgi:hypothetical protein
MAKQSRIYRSIPKYMQKKAERVNKMLNAWDAAGLTSNDLELAKELLSDFYEDIGKTPKDMERASEHIKLNRGDKEEYNKILDFIIYNDEIDLSRRTLKNEIIKTKWKQGNFDAFEKIKDEYEYIEDEQDYINFIDRMNKTKNNRVLSILMDSDQFAEAYSTGSSKGLKETKINKYIMKEYNKDGKTFDSLFEHIIEIIEKEPEKISSMK